MRLRVLLLALLLPGVAVSGCTRDGGEGGAPPTGATPMPTGPTAAAPGAGEGVLTSIKVGVGADRAPFAVALPSGEIVGFDIDVAREVGNRSGLTADFVRVAPEDLVARVQQGRLHAAVGALPVADEDPEGAAFSVPYYENQLLVAVPASNGDIREGEDLRGKRVCALAGSASEAWLRERAGATNDTLVLVSAFPACADALEDGRAEALMHDRAAARGAVRESGGGLKEALTIDTDERFGILVAKADPRLLPRVDAALVAMKQDGTLDRLKAKWSA